MLSYTFELDERPEPETYNDGIARKIQFGLNNDELVIVMTNSYDHHSAWMKPDQLYKLIGFLLHVQSQMKKEEAARRASMERKPFTGTKIERKPIPENNADMDDEKYRMPSWDNKKKEK